MHSGMLRRLADNSRAAINGGTYDVSSIRARTGSSHDLLHSISTGPHATLIAEVKFSSPSLGKIRTAPEPVQVARHMVAGGARALSVLTQPHLFDGSPEYLVAVRDAVDVPLIMKDVIVDKVQVDAGRRIGADYILLIQSLFSQGHAGEIGEMISYCHRRGLKVLLEVHTRHELEEALGAGADLVGINNRNLDTLEIDLGTTARILSGIKKKGPIVSESGITSPDDIRYLRECGADAFLVGSSIMKSDNIEAHVRGLVNAY